MKFKFFIALFVFFSANVSSFDEKIEENIELDCISLEKYDDFEIINFVKVDGTNGLDIYSATFDFLKAVRRYGEVYVISQYVAIDQDNYPTNILFESTFKLNAYVHENSKVTLVFDLSSVDRKSSVIYKFSKLDSGDRLSSYYRFFDLNKIKKCAKK